MIEGKEFLDINPFNAPDFHKNKFFDKIEIYNKAKDTYYNSGESIMSDAEFDELESELGLENQGYIGSKSKHYTIPHPFIMGSISKVNVKFDENGEIDFDKYKLEVEKYLKKSNHYNNCYWKYEVTPKLDGCSFECVIDQRGNLVSVSTRGDGRFGKNIINWFLPEWEKNYYSKMKNWINKLDIDSYMFIDRFVIRGEVLVDKKIFENKYSKDFTIPRSFVSGVINQDWEATEKQIEMRNDLSFITYDYREVYDNGQVIEVDYDDTYPGVIIENRHFFKHNIDMFKEIYLGYEKYRNETCQFCLDGFVVKPHVDFRLNDNSRERQEDCVAVKFTPEIVSTQIKKIEWKEGKTGEYFPTAIVQEVILGGKKINRVSLHNYDYIVRNGCGDGGLGVDGAIIQISLSGDVIPFICKVIKPCEQPIFSIPTDSYVIEDEKSGCKHLMKKMSEVEKCLNSFRNSIRVLNIDGIGEKVGDKLFDIIHLANIIDFMNDEIYQMIIKKLGNSKSTINIINALKNKRKNITLPEIIESFGFENCGKKNSLWLAKKISGINVSNDGIPSTIIDLSNSNLSEIEYYINKFNIPLLKEEKVGIPVILTGKPTQYDTKKNFLNQNPQYIETTSWKECKILFTDSLDSTSSKMQKARKNGIEIKLY